jgi:5,10-methylenetetrahydromethanopterin reductase
MRFGFGGVRALAMVEAYEDAIDLAKYAESLGYDSAWFSDSPSYRDPYTMMALSSLQTKTISVGIAVANPYTRHPIVTARAIATVDEISKGRARLCIATGDVVEILRPLGYELKTPYAVVGESVQLIRKYLSNEEVTFDGRFFKLSSLRLAFKVQRRIPIYVAGGGPKIMETAGAVADGALINFFDKKLIEKSIDHIRKGAQSAQRILGKDFVLNCFGPMILVKNESERKAVLTDLKAFVALNMLLTPEKWLLQAGIKPDVITTIKKSYVAGAHRNVELERTIIRRIEHILTEDVMDLFCLIGDNRYMVEKLDQLSKKEIQNVVIWMKGMEGDEKKSVLKKISESIIPSFASA